MVSLARRPPGAADILDVASARVRDAAAPLLALSASVVAPAVAVAASAPVWPSGARGYVIGVPLGLSLLVGVPAAVLVLGEGGLGRRPPWLRCLARASRRLPATAVLTAAAVLETAVLTLLGVVPGVARLGRLQAALPVLMLEKARPALALRRSRFLLTGADFLAVRAVVGAVLATAAVAAAPVTAVFVLVPLPSDGSQTLVDARLLLAAMMLGMLLIPALAAVQFTIFLVRREQLEALDLQLALQALDDATPRIAVPVGAAVAVSQ